MVPLGKECSEKLPAYWGVTPKREPVSCRQWDAAARTAQPCPTDLGNPGVWLRGSPYFLEFIYNM